MDDEPGRASEHPVIDGKEKDTDNGHVHSRNGKDMHTARSLESIHTIVVYPGTVVDEDCPIEAC